MKFYLTLIIVLLLLLFAFIFGSQNDHTITINYIIAQTTIPVAMAVSIFTLIGFLLALFSLLLWKMSKPFQRKDAQKSK